MRVSMESRGDGGQCGREPRQAGVELMDGGAEREPGDVERHSYGGHGGDDAFDLEAQGLIGGDGDGHGWWGISFRWQASRGCCPRWRERGRRNRKTQQVAQLLVDLNQ